MTTVRSTTRSPKGGVDAKKDNTTEVWAQLLLCDEDCLRVNDFFISEVGLKRNCIVRRLHITVYHARRPMPG